MSCHHIRRLTGDERAEREGREAEMYADMRAQVEGEMAAQYLKDFGPTYRTKHPFKLNADTVHDTVLARLRAAAALA